MGPTVYAWMRLASIMWPRTDIKSSFCKAITEQAGYDPMAISTFLFTMSLMEGKTYEEAKHEVSVALIILYWNTLRIGREDHFANGGSKTKIN